MHTRFCGWCGWPGPAPCARCGYDGPPLAGDDDIDLHALDGVDDRAIAVAEAARTGGDLTAFVSRCMRAAELPAVVARPDDDALRWDVETRPVGPLRVRLAGTALSATLPLVKLPARLQVPLLRRVLALNPRLVWIRLALHGDVVLAGFEFDTDLITAATLVEAFTELLRNAPPVATHLAAAFAARRIEPGGWTPAERAREPVAPGATPADLAARAEATRARADELCQAIERVVAVVRPLVFRGDGALAAVLVLRAFMVELHLDGAAPDVASKLLHHGGGLLEPLWPPREERGWVKRLVSGSHSPFDHAVTMVPVLIRLLDEIAARRAQIPPQPPRALAPFASALDVRTQARGVLDFIREDTLLDPADRATVARATLRELLARGRLPASLRERFEGALEIGDLASAQRVLGSVQ